MLFADDPVPLAFSSRDLQCEWERFTAECEATWMKVRSSKSEAVVLNQKKVACPLRVGDESLPLTEEFKYLWILFMSDGKLDREMNRLTGVHQL